jgi:hypothetical protein
MMLGHHILPAASRTNHHRDGLYGLDGKVLAPLILLKGQQCTATDARKVRTILGGAQMFPLPMARS